MSEPQAMNGTILNGQGFGPQTFSLIGISFPVFNFMDHPLSLDLYIPVLLSLLLAILTFLSAVFLAGNYVVIACLCVFLTTAVISGHQWSLCPCRCV